jgi:hypothetical protein
MALPIQENHFKDYPPEARRVATGHLELLRKLPAAFTPLLLQQIQAYDWRFPAERRDIDRQLTFLKSLAEADRRRLFTGFAQLKLPARLLDAKWLRSPVEFSEQLSHHLWTTSQIDAFHEASDTYLKAVFAALPEQPPAAPRLGIAVIGKGVERNSYPLFRKFRPHGSRFTNVNPANGLKTLLAHVADRAAAHPSSFDHWYIDGGEAEPVSHPFLTNISYRGLDQPRLALLRKTSSAIQSGIAGPKELLSLLHGLQPAEIGFAATNRNDAILSHFATSLLTSGSGTQIFSTSFVQWATRELWRRAQPLTMLARFAPRQRLRPMNEMLAGDEQKVEMDAPGALIDADMGAYYMWLSQQRLAGAEQSSFLVWFEDHAEALVVSPKLPRNTESNAQVDLRWLLAQTG